MSYLPPVVSHEEENSNVINDEPSLPPSEAAVLQRARWRGCSTVPRQMHVSIWDVFSCEGSPCSLGRVSCLTIDEGGAGWIACAKRTYDGNGIEREAWDRHGEYEAS